MMDANLTSSSTCSEIRKMVSETPLAQRKACIRRVVANQISCSICHRLRPNLRSIWKKILLTFHPDKWPNTSKNLLVDSTSIFIDAKNIFNVLIRSSSKCLCNKSKNAVCIPTHTNHPTRICSPGSRGQLPHQQPSSSESSEPSQPPPPRLAITWRLKSSPSSFSDFGPTPPPAPVQKITSRKGEELNKKSKNNLKVTKKKNTGTSSSSSSASSPPLTQKMFVLNLFKDPNTILTMAEVTLIYHDQYPSNKYVPGKAKGTEYECVKFYVGQLFKEGLLQKIVPNNKKANKYRRVVVE